MSGRFAKEIFSSDPYLLPKIGMSPYCHTSLVENQKIFSSTKGDELNLAEYLGEGQYLYALNGRDAIEMSLRHLNLSTEDEIQILTTSGNSYISGCVTSSIEKFCRWSRTRSTQTKALFLIHEFGFPLEADQIQSDELPVIEDCAYAMGCRFQNGQNVGTIGDYVIYSLSKSFPIGFGGLLKLRSLHSSVAPSERLSELGGVYLKSMVSHYLPQLSASLQTRLDLFEVYQSLFQKKDLSSLFVPQRGSVPHSFVVNFSDESLLKRLKPMINGLGVESSVYYNSGGYFLPLHQNMAEVSVEYVVHQFLNSLDQINMES